jgi:hypothetical protein
VSDRLDVVISTLGPDERRVLLGIAERLAMGRGVYGALNIAGDSRDWNGEQRDELLDFLVYREIGRLSRGGYDDRPTDRAPAPEPAPADEAPRLVGADRGMEVVGG